MYFQSIVYVTVLTAATLASGIVIPAGLSDGTWSGDQLPNGTTITTCLSDPMIPPIIEHHEVSPSIYGRGSGDGSCWGYQLDPASVDSANDGLQAYFGVSGFSFCSTATATRWVGDKTNDALVYYCVDTPSACIVVDSETIREGMGFMDDICQPYEAGWALDGSATDGVRFLMGKCSYTSSINSVICQ